ncbi:AAA family ATPase [Nocardia sp. NPDC058480]|uniref:nucleotide-binding protein n=1 Tax=Nocardia sp. NPDC058480 TaxID=3346522 RepID=UPI00365EF4B8
MSRNNDSLPMLPPWLSESDVTQVGYEAPVENLPQDDEIDEAPKRRRFMGRGDDAPRKDKGRRRRKDRESEEEAPAQQSARPAEPHDQRRPAEPTHQSGSGWSTAQQPANPLIPGPSHQQPRGEEQPRQQPTYDQPPHQAGRDYPQSPSREQQAAQAQGSYQPTQAQESYQQPAQGSYQQPAQGQGSYQQPAQGQAPSPQPTREQPPHQQASREPQAGRDGSQYQQPHQQAVPEQPNTGWQAGPNPLTPPTSAPPASTDPAPRPDAHGSSPIPGPSAADPAPWAGGQASSTSSAPWPTAQPPADPALSSTGAPPSLPPSPTSGHPHAGPATPAPNTEAADHAANALPTRTPAAPSTGFTPLGPNQQRPDLPPPPPLPDPPARPTQAPPRLTVPPQPTTAEQLPVAADREVEQAGHAAPQPVPPREEAGQPSTDSQSTSARAAERETRPAPSFQEAEQATPARQAGNDAPESATATTSSPAAESPASQTTGAPHASGGWAMPGEDAPANTVAAENAAQPTAAEPQAAWDSFADHTQSPTTADRVASEPRPHGPSTTSATPDPLAEAAQAGSRSPQAASDSAAQRHAAQTPPDYSTPETSSEAGRSDARSPHAASESAPQHGSPYSSGESVAPQRPPATEQRSPYASGENVPPPAYPATQYNSVPGDPTPVVPTHAPDGRTEVFRSDDPRLQTRPPGVDASGQGGANAAEQARAAQTGYRSGEFVQAADTASPYPRPDGTPAQHQQPDGLPTYGPDGVAQRSDGAAPQYRPDAAPAQHQHPDGTPAPQYRPDGSPAPQYQQPNQGTQQQFPPNGPAQQFQPDGSPAQQYNQPNGPGQQFQPNGPGQQYQPDGTPAQQYNQPNGPGQQYQPDGTPAQYQQPNAAPQQYQQPSQGQQPHGQPGWGAQPQGYQPSLDNVPVKRAKKAPGSGWRKAVHHASGGAINPGMSAEELRLQELVARIRQPVRGDYRIAVLSLKGGVGKTTTTTGIGSIFASIRGDRVIAVDANPDFGTLSQRVAIQTRSTVRDLLLDPSIQRYSDVRRHTSQGSSRLEVLASERDPAASEAFNDEEYRAVARILQRFYNIILTDCGTGLMHSAMSGVLDLAHSLVLISSAAIDGARSAAATLDWLSLHGHDHLVRNAVVVINLPREGSPNVGIQQLREYFLSRCRAVHIIPFDEHLSEGAEIDLHRLHKSTKRAYVELAATVADEFGVDHRRIG